MPIRRLRARRLRVLILLTVLFAAGAGTALAATHTVFIRDSYFSVKTLTISRGSRVSWQWKGALNHNVSVKSGPVRFHSRTQYSGSYSHTFLRSGTYRLYCTLHPYMKMTVVVR